MKNEGVRIATFMLQGVGIIKTEKRDLISKIKLYFVYTKVNINISVVFSLCYSKYLLAARVFSQQTLHSAHCIHAQTYV